LRRRKENCLSLAGGEGRKKIMTMFLFSSRGEEKSAFPLLIALPMG